MAIARQLSLSLPGICTLLVSLVVNICTCGAVVAQDADPVPKGETLDAAELTALERWLATDRARQLWYEQAADRLDQFQGVTKAAAEIRDGTARRATETDGRDSAQAATPLDLLLQQRRLVAEQVAILERKVALEQAELDAVLEPVIDLPEEIASPRDETPAEAAAGEPASSEETSETPAAITNPIQAAMQASASSEPSAAASEAADERPESFDPYVADAQSELHNTVARSKAATERAEQQSVAIKLFELDLRNVQRWIELAERGVEMDGQEQPDDAPLHGLREEFWQESLQRHRRWEPFIANQIERLKLSRERTVASIRRLEDEAESLRMRLAFLRSPLAPHRVKRWLVTGGPHVIFIAAVTLLAWLVSRFMTARVASAIAKHRRTGTADERQERSETLRRMVQGMINLSLLVIATIALLGQFGVEVTVLLGGAAVLGMAVAFGAQNLIKDYFGGLLILMEDQYRVGNVIRIGSISGTVEDVSMRMTVLRDLEGIAHFIPHGQISTVSNLSHGWSRAVLDIGVAYKEDVDRVIDVLRDVTDQFTEDPDYSSLVLERAEILGVDALGDSAVVVKLMIKTRPLKQWEVKRTLLRLIKNRFDELGIEIPFPHRTIYHRSEDDSLAASFAGETRRG